MFLLCCCCLYLFLLLPFNTQPQQQQKFVEMADEAYNIGAAPVNQSYLNMQAILDVVKKTGAEAVSGCGCGGGGGVVVVWLVLSVWSWCG